MDLQKYEDIINGEKKESFESFKNLLLFYNNKFNLTAITDEKDIYIKHFLDCAAGDMFFEEGVSVVEIGSGGGFPSVPLKLIRDDLQFTLVESTGKKCDYLKAVVDKLNLSCVQVINARAEELSRDKKYREKFDVCTARAVAKLNTLAEYCLPFVKVGGRFIAYKGNCDEEFKEALKAFEVLGGEPEIIEKYGLPNGETRTLVVVKKVKHTPEKYPRGQGKERKSPII
ncbi:MAG: 16S rRNA (guanine(527)-N(7))-methyltransferase RsmG [Clostridiales bacterium]|nr:16S rRNA (guanine(527)-N(7))-methyltransferase RsmG [Clostridiales bacterium]